MTQVGPDARPRSVDVPAALLRTLGAALLGAGLWVFVGGPLGAHVGLLAIALFAGWMIGAAARSGAGSRGGPAVPVALAGALVAWALALTGVYVYSLAAIPGLPGADASGTDLVSRMRDTPIGTFYAAQFGLLDALEGVLLLGTAWWTAR